MGAVEEGFAIDELRQYVTGGCLLLLGSKASAFPIRLLLHPNFSF